MNNTTHAPQPSTTIIEGLIPRELASGPRIAVAALLTVDAIVIGVITILLLTDWSDLPIRTRAAFLVMVTLGMVWAGWFAWMLTRRRVLFARQRVHAAIIAVLGALLFAAFAITIAVMRTGAQGVLTAMACSLTLLVVAITHLVYVRRRYLSLLRRRSELDGAWQRD